MRKLSVDGFTEVKELQPTDRQKSFYKKAFICRNDRCIALLSYHTIVCFYDYETDRVYRSWDGWSATTAKHVNSFLETIAHPKVNKSEWYKMPFSDKYPVRFMIGGEIHDAFNYTSRYYSAY